MVPESLSDCGDISLDDLSNGIPAISPRSSGYFVEACMVCLDSQGHSSGVEMQVKTDEEQLCYTVHWIDPVTEQLHLNFGGNKNKTTEKAQRLLHYF